MLMQLIAWVLGVPLILLALAYATIFTAVLTARFRQAHAGLEHSESHHRISH